MITKSTDAKNAACNSIVDLLDQGSDTSNGLLNLYDYDGTTISSLSLSYPAFMDSTDGTAQAWPISDSTAYIDATAITFEMIDRDGTWVYGGSVSGLSGDGDLKLNSAYITKDSTVSISSAYFIVP